MLLRHLMFGRKKRKVEGMGLIYNEFTLTKNYMVAIQNKLFSIYKKNVQLKNKIIKKAVV